MNNSVNTSDLLEAVEAMTPTLLTFSRTTKTGRSAPLPPMPNVEPSSETPSEPRASLATTRGSEQPPPPFVPSTRKTIYHLTSHPILSGCMTPKSGSAFYYSNLFIKEINFRKMNRSARFLGCGRISWRAQVGLRPRGMSVTVCALAIT